MKNDEFFRPLIEAMEKAGFELLRRNPSGSHFIMTAPNRPHVTVPRKLGNHRLARRIAKVAGVAL